MFLSELIYYRSKMCKLLNNKMQKSYFKYNMRMTGQYVYVQEKTIRKYIKVYGRKLLGKEYELGAGVILKNFFEKEVGLNFKIGLKLKSKYSELYKNINEDINIHQLKEIIEKHVDQDNPADIAISPILNLPGFENLGWTFQLKRFGHFQIEKDTEGLIKYLRSIKKKYSKKFFCISFLLRWTSGN